MANAYADLATLKSPAVLNAPDDTHDARLLGMLEAASRWIDGYCGRQFGAVHGERRFDGTGKASLTVPDLVTVSSMRVREASGQWVRWLTADWLLYPLNAAPTEPSGRPYTRVMLAGKHRRFPLSRAGVAVSGVWGYGDVREDAGQQVADGSAVTADAAVVVVAPASAGAAVPLSAGHTVRIGSEQLYVTGVTAGVGKTTLSVQRGVNGTVASAHAVGAGLSVYRYPSGVAEACLLQAAVWWRERLGGPFTPDATFDQSTGAGGGDVGGLSPTVRTLLAPYRRRHAVLGV